MKLIFLYFSTLSIGILIAFGIASLVGFVIPGLKIIIFIVLSAYWLFTGWKYAKYRDKAQLKSKTIKPSSFPIGPYKLNMLIKDFRDLREISDSEYNIYQKQFQDELILRAPSVNFLGFSWDMMLGVGHRTIYKIAPEYKTKDKNHANDTAMKVLAFCKSKLGEPSEQQTGFYIWDTIDGNIIFQTEATSDGFGVFLFLTSKIIKEFR